MHTRIKWLNLAAVVIPLALYFVLTLPLSEWLMDDAGISFVYSRNLAAGHGLVSQPGVEPVEGYSNFLWVVLMAVFFAIGLFEPFITSKAVSLILVALSYWFLHKSIQKISGSRFLLSFIALMFLSFNTSFVSWTCSGLENPLTAVLVALLLYLNIQFVSSLDRKATQAAIVAVVAVGIALTRPDAVLYAVVFPMTLLFLLIGGRMRLGELSKNLGYYGVTYLIGYGGFIMFRWLYFGDLYPNTYHAKGGPTMKTLVSVITFEKDYLSKFRDLFASVLGPYVWMFIPACMIFWVGLMLSRREDGCKDAILLTVTGMSVLAYQLLGYDWMGEYRFATAFFPLIYLCLAVFGYRIIRKMNLSRNWTLVITITVVLTTAIVSLVEHYPRLQAKYDRPRVSFSGIAEAFGTKFNRYADFLELSDASLLLPDIGGTLYYSDLRIYDLAGLCDRTIARTRRKNQQAFYDYVFEEAKPTFIHTHGFFTIESRFDEDYRFERDYLAIDQYEDEYAFRRLKRKIMSGDFVRRDAVEGKEDKLAALRNGHLK